MDGPHEVSIDELLKISKKMYNSYFPSTDIYSLLLLSLVTVTAYSRKKHHLNAHTRIELSIAILPELIMYLIKDNVITALDGKKISGQCETKKEELAIILRSYIYASEGLHVTTKTNKKKEQKCYIV